MNALTVQEILYLHDRIIEETGGAHGVRDVGLLESALEATRQTHGGKLLYRTIWLQAAALTRNLIQDHPFVDGNKRTAISSAGILLERHGFHLESTQQALVAFTISVVEKKLDVETIAHWLKIHALEDRALGALAKERDRATPTSQYLKWGTFEKLAARRRNKGS